jgi:hypothetical protein
MSAPKGNRFWKLRSKHGRDKLFATPELLWEAACEYFEWCKENPWIKVEQSKSPQKPVQNKETKEWAFPLATVNMPTERPLTVTGLCLYLDCNVKYFNDFKKNLKEKDKDFSPVITRIEETIYTQKFEGAAVGVFNANIIARDLGLADKQDHSGEITVKQITGMIIK